MFRDTTVSYPGSKPQLRRYCGPAYDIDPTMTATILKGNGEYPYLSTLRVLTDEESLTQSKSVYAKRSTYVLLGSLEKEQSLRISLKKMILKHLIMIYINVKPIPDHEDLGYQHFDLYLNAEVLPPFQEHHQTATVKHRKLDINGNRM